MAKTETEKPKITNIIAASIQPGLVAPDVDEKGKGTNFTITYVRNGERSVKKCTEEVWRWVENAKPWNDTRVEWIINVNQAESGRVVGVTRKPRLDSGPLSTRLDVDLNNHLGLQKTGATFDPVNLPIAFQTPVLEEAIAAMNKAGMAKAGEILDDKVKVEKVLAVDDTKVYVLSLL